MDEVVYTKVCTGKNGGCVRQGADSLREAVERLSLGDEDEWDGWGFWDADARIDMLESTQGGIGVQRRCKWKNEQGQIFWLEHADRCAAVFDEIKAALKSSLERKVASLETDRWMFEGESGKGLR